MNHDERHVWQTVDSLASPCIPYADKKAVQGMDIHHAEYPVTEGDDEVYLYEYSGMIECESDRFTAGVGRIGRLVR